MSKELKLSEILKNAPSGIKLYSPIFGDVEFVGIASPQDFPYTIEVMNSLGETQQFTDDGRYFADFEDCDCMLFPTRTMQNWDGWQFALFKAGHYIFNEETNETYYLISKDEAVDKHGYVVTYSYINHCSGIYTKLCRFASFNERMVLSHELDKIGYDYPTSKGDSDTHKNHSTSQHSDFKVGDVLIHELWGDILKIDKIENGKYYDKNGGFYRTDDKGLRLWNIRDAKIGDIVSDRKLVGVFKKSDYTPTISCGCMYLLCVYDMKNNVFNDTEVGGFNPTNWYPASDDEAKLLASKMEDCGLFFDKKKSVMCRHPKFKRNDWIISNDDNSVRRICEIENGKYSTSDGRNGNENLGFWKGDIEYVDSVYRLWTIDDARDCDILANEKFVAMYKHTMKGHSETGNLRITFRFGYDWKDGRIRSTEFTYELRETDNWHPATKFEQVSLIVKMESLDYKWDGTTKDLIYLPSAFEVGCWYVCKVDYTSYGATAPCFLKGHCYMPYKCNAIIGEGKGAHIFHSDDINRIFEKAKRSQIPDELYIDDGDYIVNNKSGDIVFVQSYNRNSKNFTLVNGSEKPYTKSVLDTYKYYHKFGVNDLRDGMYVTSSYGEIGIFKSVDEDGDINLYCKLNTNNGRFTVSEGAIMGRILASDGIFPSTPQEIKKFTETIAEHGYKWDSNKKVALFWKNIEDGDFKVGDKIIHRERGNVEEISAITKDMCHFKSGVFNFLSYVKEHYAKLKSDNMKDADDNDNPNSTSKQDCDKCDIKQRTTIKPHRFDLGEWVVDENGGTHKINTITEYTYQFDDCKGETIKTVDSTYKKWDFSMAKCGDILASASGSRIFKYNGRLCDSHPCADFGVYKITDDDYAFMICIDPTNKFTTEDTVWPATKRQKDILIVKAGEKGYAYNDKTKTVEEYCGFDSKSNWVVCVKDYVNKGAIVFHRSECYNFNVLNDGTVYIFGKDAPSWTITEKEMDEHFRIILKYDTYKNAVDDELCEVHPINSYVICVKDISEQNDKNEVQHFIKNCIYGYNQEKNIYLNGQDEWVTVDANVAAESFKKIGYITNDNAIKKIAEYVDKRMDDLWEIIPPSDKEDMTPEDYNALGRYMEMEQFDNYLKTLL